MFDRIFIHCLVILAMCASVAQAKPLTMEDLKNAKRIGLMPGTYDPVTDGHIGAAKAAIAQSDLDMLILIPQENPHKFPIPREERLQMIDLAAKDLDKIYYAKKGSDLYDLFSQKHIIVIAQKIRELNPNAELDLVAGSDFAANKVTAFLFQHLVRPKGWIVVDREGSEDLEYAASVNKRLVKEVHMAPLDVSSSGIKNFLKTHSEVYSPKSLESAPISGLNPEVQNFILKNELYKNDVVLTCPEKMRKVLVNLIWKS